MPQGGAGAGEKCACFGREQIDDGAFRIRPCLLGRIADVLVMRGHLPRAFLADRPDRIHNGIQIHGCIAAQRAADKIGEPAAAGKVLFLIRRARSGAKKNQPIRCCEHRDRGLQCDLRAFCPPPFYKFRRKTFLNHFFFFFCCIYSRGLSPVSFLNTLLK